MNNASPNGVVPAISVVESSKRRVVQSSKPADSEAQALRARLAEVEAENARLKAPKPIELTVHKNGYVIVRFGKGRQDRVFYKDEWEAMKAQAARIDTFLADNRDKLK